MIIVKLLLDKNRGLVYYILYKGMEDKTMTVLNYNVTLKDGKEFVAEREPKKKSGILERINFLKSKPKVAGSDEFFEEKLEDKGSPRPAWGTVLKRVKMLSMSNPHDTIVVRVKSLEALQASSKEDFERMVGGVLKAGGSIWSIDEEAVFTRATPNGVSNNPKKFKAAMLAIESQGKNPAGIVRLPKHNSKGQIEI